MMCPLCARPLDPVERQGVEIDYCSQCGGIWLDQGELSELIRREAVAAVVKGQDVLLAARQEREYDRLASVGTEPASSFAVALRL